MKRWLSLLLAVALYISCVSAVNAEDAADAGGAEYVPFINGFEDGTFCPDKNMTRAEAAALFAGLVKDSGKEEIHFTDVSSHDWYYDSLCVLNANGFLRNYAGSFSGKWDITRLELCELVYMLKNGVNAALTREDMFADLVGTGVVKGYGDGSYGADNAVSRAEAVALVNRALGVTADAAAVASMNRKVFRDIDSSHWAFYDVIMAAKDSRRFVSYPDKIPEDYATKEFDKYNEKGSEWQAVPMINDALRAKGVTMGGEGAQRMNSIAISSDGSFLLCGNDISSIHRSIDGGQTWEKCNHGFYALSGEAFAIDPNNNDRCIGLGGSHDRQSSTNGIYLSTDRGYTWNKALTQLLGTGQLELRESLCYDASSYDEEIGGSAVAYWSKNYWLRTPSAVYQSEEEIPKIEDENEKKGLWKTTDGGQTWFVVNTEMTDSIIKVHPKDGTVYAANLNGFFRSADGGVTFTRILSGSMIYGLDVVATRPDYVYLNDYKGVLLSTDSGKTFQRIESTTFPKSVDITNPFKSVVNLKVSPANPDNMVVAYYEGFGVYKCKKYYSNDGGVTWAASVENGDKDFFVNNNRETMYVWHPTEPDKVWAFGGDWVVSSIDAGKTFSWDYNGGSAVFVDQRTIFNLYNPDIFYYGSQDFHGALTIDGGVNWKHIWKCVGNQWAGFVYGSYAADENTLIALVSTSQAINGVGSNGGWGGVSEIRVSRDGGETWAKTGVYILENHRQKWAEICYQSPKNPQVLFAANYRSDDYGYSWEKMDVDAVYTHNPYGEKELYAGKDQYIMVSYDDGKTWREYCQVKIPETLAETPEKTSIWDMSYDGVNGIMYYISGNGVSGTDICKYQNGVTTELTNNRVQTENGKSFQLCAVDPRYPNVVYIGGYQNAFVNGCGVQRSVDGGETFQVISNVDPEVTIVKTGICGGIEPYDLIVHPITGELYVPQGCAGWAKIAPPYEN